MWILQEVVAATKEREQLDYHEHETLTEESGASLEDKVDKLKLEDMLLLALYFVSLANKTVDTSRRLPFSPLKSCSKSLLTPLAPSHTYQLH